MMDTSLDVQLDLSDSLPPIFILSTHLQVEELHELEETLYSAGVTLTLRASEARIFLTRISQKKRATLELRSRGVWSEETTLKNDNEVYRTDQPPSKRRRIASKISDASSPVSTVHLPDLTDHVMIVKHEWLSESVKQNLILPYQDYLVYYGKIVSKPQEPSSSSPHSKITYIKATPNGPSTPSIVHVSKQTTTSPTNAKDILERAKADAPKDHNKPPRHALPARRRFGYRSNRSASPELKPSPYGPKLHRRTTSEFETDQSKSLPDPPDWVTDNNSFSCCRDTPMQTQNVAFIVQLTKIKDARLLILDEIGVRAYSTSIASIAAYPHTIQSTAEILRLPGCNERIATLWAEWFDSADEDTDRSISYVRDLEKDKDLSHLRTFWSCWGVGPDTARKWYFDNGWQDLDDVVEFGWDALSRVQQIGVKYRDEFEIPIPRHEVEQIADVIHRHARLARNIKPEQHDTTEDIVCVIVGGYRRGKTQSGDVDVILSHREESYTKDLIIDVVKSLEEENLITHTLSLHTTTSDRGQATLPFRAERREHRFDSLDKALCVWQDPDIYESPKSTTSDTSQNEDDNDDDENTNPQNPPKKNPNLHRRVDIIITPWRTVGCAVLGWSGGTTFQRDIRRFVQKEKGWKFDSSGIRDRGNGRVLDLESPRSWKKLKKENDEHKKGEVDEMDENIADKKLEDWEVEDTYSAREKRLMINMGFGYREPWLRCTG